MPRGRPPSSPAAALSAATAATAAGGPTSTTSTILNHTFAPFYACYLLKSYNPKRLNQTYIGSTPDPPRRFRQHMGETVGGAFKTRLARPWEMEAIVYGFPTKLQALQFEWAWQNPHASRLLHAVPVSSMPEPDPPLEGPAAAESSKFGASKKKKPKADKPPKPVAHFPRTAASNRGQTRIQVLQFMLTVPPWRSFNLRVMLFSDLAQEWWNRARQGGPTIRTDAGWNKLLRDKAIGQDQTTTSTGKGKSKAPIVVDEHGDAWGARAKWLDRVQVDVRRDGVDGERLVRTGEKSKEAAIGRLRVDDDDFFQTQWSKWTELVSTRHCSICKEAVDHEDHLSFFLCTTASSSSVSLANSCSALYHPRCLSSHFLQSPATRTTDASPEPTAAPPAVIAAPLLPTHGSCPTCYSELHWTDLVRSSYRRMEEVEGKRKKRTKQRVKAAGATSGAVQGTDEEEDDDREAGDPSSDVSSAPSTPRERKKRSAAVSSAKSRRTSAKTKSKAPRKKLSSPAAETSLFNFSTDPGPEDSSDEEATSSSDLEKSFARIEAAQDALNGTDGDGVELESQADLDEPLEPDGSESEEELAPLSILARPPPGQPAAKRAAPSSVRRRRADTSASTTLTTTLTRSFTSSKPVRKRSKPKEVGKSDIDPISTTAGTAPQVDAGSPDAAAARACSNRRLPAQHAAPKKPRKPVMVYVELSD